MKINFKKAIPHLIIVIILLSISMIYFSPALKGYRVFQSDIQQHKGMSNEVVDHRAEFNEEPLWTNSMFGGMPATQISVIYKSNLLRYVNNLMKLGLPHPVNYLFLYMIGFYILLMCMKVDPWLALIGSIAYGFSSYFFIITEVGHNSKALAVAYMAPALGGFLLAFRGKKFLGTSIFTLFISLQIGANHPQVTYYFFLLLFSILVYEIIRYIRDNKIKDMCIRLGLLFIGTMLSISASVPNLYGTYEYSKHSQRAGSELASSNESLKISETSDDYKKTALRWSYGKGETWSFLIPDIKGGGDASLSQNEKFQETDGYNNLKRYMQVKGFNEYWGNQPGTSGPVFIGSIICFLCFLGLVFWKNKLKWPIIILTLIAIFLSWGKNMEWFTDIFWNYSPLYNKFRAVTIILVLVELTFPVIAILWLSDAINDKKWLSEKFQFFGKIKSSITNKKMIISLSGVFVFILLLFIVTPSSFFEFISTSEKEYQFNQSALMIERDKQAEDETFLKENNITKEQFNTYYNNNILSLIPKAKKELSEYRQTVFTKSVSWSLLFIVITCLLLFAYFKYDINRNIFISVLGFLFLLEMWPVAREYLNNEEGLKRDYEHWIPSKEKLMPITASIADYDVYKHEVSNNSKIGEIIQNILSEKELESDDGLEQRERDRIVFGKLNRLTNYRVLNIPTGVFQETYTSYFHKSLGGYHSAKIQRYQDLIDSLFQNEIKEAQTFETDRTNILNMLNTKYIIMNPYGNRGFVNNYNEVYALNLEEKKQITGFVNENTMGNAWFVKEVVGYNNPKEEFKALKKLDPKLNAITDTTFERNQNISNKYLYNELAKISMTGYRANKITYEVSEANGEGDFYAVFSEIYYPLGWKAKIDGKEVEINRVNYTLRGLKIPANAKKIELYYELESFSNLSALAFTSSSLIILLVLGLGYLSVFKNSDA